VLPLLLLLVVSARASDEEYDEEEIEHRNSLTWGRIFLDGASNHHQYFKARFGGDIPIGRHPMKLADPLIGCTMPTNKDQLKGAIVFVKRGECTFATKARFMQVAGASAVLIISNDASLTHLPGPDGKDVEIGVGMVTHDYGIYAQAALKRESIQGQLMPIYCEKETGTSVCLPVTEAEKSAHTLTEGGHLTLSGEERKIEFLTAKFGGPVPANSYKLILASPTNACTELDNAQSADNSVVIMDRGGCTFLDKVVNVQKAGGAVALMVNSQPTLLRMDALKRYEAYNVTTTTLMITKSSGDFLKAAINDSPKEVFFEARPEIRAATWDQLKNAITPEQWPMDQQGKTDMYMKLREQHESSNERLGLLNTAFRNTGDDAEEVLKKFSDEL